MLIMSRNGPASLPDLAAMSWFASYAWQRPFDLWQQFRIVDYPRESAGIAKMFLVTNWPIQRR
jgi:hypothetical protein